MLARSLSSLGLCLLLVGLLPACLAETSALRNLCDANRKVIGVMDGKGQVARVDSSGKQLDNLNGYCECHSVGMACPTPPMDNIFKEAVYCAVKSSNECPSHT